MAMNFVYTWFWTNMDRHISEAQEVAGKAGSSWNVWKPLMGSPLSSLKIFVTVATRLSPFGYGSIPINTIFRGMNIHLPAILMWTTGVQGFDTLPFCNRFFFLASQFVGAPLRSISDKMLSIVGKKMAGQVWICSTIHASDPWCWHSSQPLGDTWGWQGMYWGLECSWEVSRKDIRGRTYFFCGVCDFEGGTWAQEMGVLTTRWTFCGNTLRNRSPILRNVEIIWVGLKIKEKNSIS